MNRTLARLLFLAFERVRGEPVGRYLAELERNQHLPVAELKELQRAKLRSLLTDVLERNEYYRAKYRGLDAIEDFSGLPILTKDELRANYERIVTGGPHPRLDLAKTSGSTGQPLKFFRDRRVFGYTLASVFRAHRWHGLDIGAKEAMLWGIPTARAKRARVRLRDALLNRFRESDYNLDPAVLDRFYRTVRRRRPDYLFGYSSMVFEFALFVEQRGLAGRDLALKKAVLTAETIPEYQRAKIESVFGCQVVSEYGSAETGIIAYECPRGRHHVADDCVLLEVVGEDGRPLGAGEVGSVVVTVLNSGSAPIIRYRLGDLASISSGTCECGVTLSLLEGVVGRTSGVIVTPQGRCFHSIAVYYIMKEYAEHHAGIAQFRVRQTHVDRLEFHLLTSGEFSEESRRWLEHKVQAVFGAGMRIELVARDRLERTPAGKMLDFETCLDSDRLLAASYRRGVPEIYRPPS